MRNVMKYLGIMSVSLACAGPLFATSVQPFAGVTVVQQSVVTVKGQVVDEKGEPIIGANVIVEGTTNGMITDLDGNFSLQCPVGSTLKTSYIGYLARTVKVTGNMNALKITLKEDTETLDEVVVVGYGTMKKSDITGAISSVSEEKIARQAVANVSTALQGLATGVSVTSSSRISGFRRHDPYQRCRYGKRRRTIVRRGWDARDGYKLPEHIGYTVYGGA